MKKLSNFTDYDKKRIFDELYDLCLESMNEMIDDEEYDFDAFFEEVVDKVLQLTQSDWDRHNNDKKL